MLFVGLRDNEIEYALSDSEIELEDDGEIDELCEDGDLDAAYVPPPEESSSSDDDEPLSDLRTTCGRARDEKPFKCTFCEYACRDSSTLRKHQTKHGGKQTFFQCKTCEKTYPDKWRLKNHVAETHLSIDIRTIPCDMCSRKFKSNSKLNFHIKAYHKRALAGHCPVCKIYLSNMNNLKIHLTTHVDARPYVCNVPACGKSYKDKGQVFFVVISSTENSIHCPVCKIYLSNMNNLKIHLTTHVDARPYVCNVPACGKSYKDKIHLTTHVDVRPYVCNVPACGKSYKDKVFFVVMPSTVNSIHCPVCKIYLSNMNNLKIHLTTHVDARPYVCNVPACGKSYKDKGTLKKHMVCHQPDRQFECEICQRVFLRKERVKRHIITVHGKRKCVECDYCGVKFFSKAYLINHITKKHTKRRKFKYICDICGLKTYNKPSIVMHLKYGHLNDNDRECKICRTVYKKHEYLKHHYRFTHDIAYKTKTRKTNELIIKEEPPDDDNISTVSIDLFEIEKTEPETTEYATQENTPSLPEVTENDPGLPELKSLIDCERIVDIPRDMFEKFYVQTFQRNTLEDTEPKEAQTTHDYDIDERALEYQNNARIQMLEDAKRRAAIEAIENAKIQAEIKKKEAVKALERARLMYNERMRKFVDKLTSEQEKKPIKIKMFQAKRTKVPNKIKDSKALVFDNNIPETTTNNDTTKINNRVTETENEKDNISITNNESDDFIDSKDKDEKEAITRNNNEKSSATKDMEINGDDAIDNNNDENANNELENANGAINYNEIENDDGMDLNDKELSAAGTSADNDDDDEEWISKSKTMKKNKKMNFNSHQCYICFKLYVTKEKLLDHCKNHFDVCNDISLKKCPLCPYVSDKFIARHLKLVHKVKIKMPYTKMQDKKDNSDGCRYYFEVNNPEIQKIEVIPSVKNLNKLASMEIDKNNREQKCKALAKTKLVRKGKEWIVETEKITIDKDVIMPKFDSEAIKNITDKIGDSDAYFDSLKKMYHLAKKSGKTMLFPCQNCEKVCRNFSALKLHSRKHETNPKPFRKKVWKHKLKPGEDYKKVDTRKKDSTNRTAKPKPIKNKHKCDPELKDFYENNIRGGDIEFWQFLKIFNKMSRDNIKDFKDLEGRHEYGINLGYIPETVEDNSNSDKQIPTSSKNEGDENNVSEKDVRRRKKTKVNKNSNYKKDKYKRVIRMSKQEYNKRNAIRQKLREKIAQKGVE
ncbi:hypothetical protein O0L34_g16092 [Tuta absoluta]|nr:hypothetical protein O0L34_g16092 [Tuta absoluta]